MKRILLVNASSRADLPLDLIATACGAAILFQVAPAWDRLPVEVIAGKFSDAGSPDDDAVIAFTDRGNVPNALGWHEVTAGRPSGTIPVLPILEGGGTWTRGAWSVSEVASHEVFELFCDPWCGTAEMGLDARSYVREVCDPVEGQPFDVELSGGAVSVADFVLPAWYRDDATSGPYNYNPDAPLLMPRSITAAGYAQWIEAGAVHEVEGALSPVWRREAHRRAQSRPVRRAARCRGERCVA